jgi:hypothetical protein
MKTYLLLATLFISAFGYSQNCIHTNLSKEYDFTTKSIVFKSTKELIDSCAITVEISKKGTDNKQAINFKSGWMFDGVFMDCNAVRSYSTGINKTVDVTDNDFGDVIVADFNFDGKDDLAVKIAFEGNGGPTYAYYLQNSNGKFIKDKYLTETVSFFPDTIDAKNKVLITRVHANAYQRCETTYKQGIKGSWKETGKRFIDY